MNIAWLFTMFAMSLGGDADALSGQVRYQLPDPLPEGLRLLLTKAYLPADFNSEIFDNLWRLWEEPRRSEAAQATPQRRRRMAYERYGLTPVEGREPDLPLQYTPTANGGWAMNCFACHGGTVAGLPIPGAPNTLFAMQTLYEEVRAYKLQHGLSFSHMDVGSMVVPLGGTVGTTNAVVFGIALGHHRDADLNFRRRLVPPRILNHDHDAPAWWLTPWKTQWYIDGFAPKHHRALMQFFLVEANGPKQYREWEPDYRKVLEWIETLMPPRYPWPIDRALADAGRAVFEKNCSSCHGTYGDRIDYPQVVVPIAEIGTDRARHDAIDPSLREGYRKSWFGREVAERVVVQSEGYVAPPLAGVWASSPYFHNGSVPTLWHLLHPGQRPRIWRRSRDGYDSDKVGLDVETFERFPPGLSNAEKRWVFDTSRFGKSAKGHDYPEALTESEKRAVLEYLKTL